MNFDFYLRHFQVQTSQKLWHSSLQINCYTEEKRKGKLAQLLSPIQVIKNLLQVPQL